MKFGYRIVFTQPTKFAVLGDEGYIVSKKYNRWLKLPICTTGHVFNIRNTPYTNFLQNA